MYIVLFAVVVVGKLTPTPRYCVSKVSKRAVPSSLIRMTMPKPSTAANGAGLGLTRVKGVDSAVMAKKSVFAKGVALVVEGAVDDLNEVR